MNFNWDLSDFGYTSTNDIRIDNDFSEIISYVNILSSYKGRVAEGLARIIELEYDMSLITNKVFVYLNLSSSTDVQNTKLTKRLSDLSNKLSQEYSKLEFIGIEIANIPDETYQQLIVDHDIVRKHKPNLDLIREDKKYQLPELVEQIITKTSGYISSPWVTLMDELESSIRFNFENKSLSEVEIFDIINNDENDTRRYDALKVVSDTLSDKGNGLSFKDYSAKCLNNIMGYSTVMMTERGFTYPMESRNRSNQLDKPIVDALHESVKFLGAQQATRYYKIVAKLLGKEKLNWSDRNAKPISGIEQSITWDDAIIKVIGSLESFSPRIASIAKTLIEQKKIDYGVYAGKSGGAFSCSAMIPNKNLSYILMNFNGREGDVSTISHEIGHSVHGLLAEEKVGALMFHAPMAICETASIFSEMLLFENSLKTTIDKKERLVLLLDKCSDWINTVVRQISFSYFENQIHEKSAHGELLVSDFDSIYLDTTKKFYGDIFNYENVTSLWCIISHFRNPYYVYSYAFGELFTQSLFAVKDSVDFETKYIDMLSKGGTEPAYELVKPFGLNPTDSEFWNNGIRISIVKWLDEIELLIEELGL